VTLARPASTSELRSAHFDEEAPVLRGRLLVDSGPRATRLARTWSDERPPVFGDEVWQLGWAQTRRNVPAFTLVLDFRRIADPLWRLTAKEFLYARLNERVTGIKKNVPVQVARQELNFLMAFASYLDGQHDGMRLGAVTQDVLDAYRLWCQQGRQGGGIPIGPQAVASYISVTVRLALCGGFLTHDRLDVTPWRGKTPYVVAGVVEATEGATPRIPEDVLAGLLRWSRFYVEVAAADILAATAEIAGMTARREGPPNKLERWLTGRRAAGRGLPAVRAPVGAEGTDALAEVVDLPLVARMAGLTTPQRLKTPAGRRLIEEAVNELGLELGGLDTAPSVDPSTGLPWRAPFSPSDLVVERRMLQAACYVIVSYLSGMRDSEVQELRRGCHEVARSEDGVIERQKLRGRTFKGHGPQGREATWVVIDPVGRAVEMLEALDRQDHLFNAPATWTYPKADNAPARARLGPGVVRQLNDFQDHVNATQSREGVAAIPMHEARPWHFSTAQFRRTLAWHIANQPFGTVAGMLQYQHVSVATFEGYVGESASGFRREVEGQRRLAALDDLVEDYWDYVAGMPSTGAGAARRDALFAHAKASVDEGAVVDDGRVRAMLKSSARTLYPGVLNDCFFERETALCLRSAGQGGNEPLAPFCQPDRCGNSVITAGHVPHWEAAIGDVRVHLSRKNLAQNQRTALRVKLQEMEAAIRPLQNS
jgi:integrase